MSMDAPESGTPADLESTPVEPVSPEGAPVGTSAEASEDLFAPTPEAPEGDEITLEWLQQRHKDMQADYTRKRQADSEVARQRQEELEFLEALRSDPDTQRSVLEELRDLLAESEVDEQQDVTPENELETQVRELREAHQAREAQELASSIAGHIEQLAKDAGVELDDHDMRTVFASATDQGIGRQETEQAFRQYVDRQKAVEDRAIKRYLASKQSGTQQVPAGTPAQDTPDLSDPDTRRKYMAAILEGSRSG